MLPDNISYNLDSAFHMLRHFSTINPELKNALLQKGYSEMQIHQELQTTGSKFFIDFADGIEALLQKLSVLTAHQVTIGINGNKTIEFLLDENEYPQGIGTMAVVPIAEIPTNDQHSIRKEENRGYEIGHYYVNQLPSTSFCTLILKPVNNGYFFISAFPGKSAMPVPRKEMNQNQYEACKQFWDHHIFLKLKQQDSNSGI